MGATAPNLDPFYVFMRSDVYGREQFGPYDTLDEALQAIGRLYHDVAKLQDGVEREIGIVINEDEDDDEELDEAFDEAMHKD